MNQPKLDRITQDPTVLDGLPTIRDTGITVSEVVKALMNGKTADDVLAEHPQLESEDVTQAVVYSTSTLVELAVIYRVESKTLTSSIAGFSELLLKTWETGYFPDDERKKFVGIILEHIGQITRFFDNLSMWGLVNYRHVPDTSKVQPLALRPVIEGTSKRSTASETQSHIDLEIIGDLPDVRDYGHLHFALLSLLTPGMSHRLKPAAMLTTERKNDFLKVQIYREYTSPAYRTYHANEFVWRYDSTGIAAHIIRQHGSELKIHPTEKGVTFEFELPIWSEPHE